MQHCSGSVYDAPWYFGASEHSSNLETNGQHVFPVPGLDDPEHDALLALVSWVEGGKEVDELVVIKYANDTVGNGILMQRPICKYPGHASWDGEGNLNDASSWGCVGYDA
ncbi:tannase-domain-containing protein [Colletotrichum falcatum]|nr:tannase-domain-containing protein [Colletotrichum falcatum]